MTRNQLNEKLRSDFLPKLTAFLSQDNDVCRIASNKIAFPVVDAEGNEKWMTVTISVPTDSEFDGYTEADFYKEKVEQKIMKAAERKAEAEERQKATEARRASKN